MREIVRVGQVRLVKFNDLEAPYLIVKRFRFMNEINGHLLWMGVTHESNYFPQEVHLTEEGWESVSTVISDFQDA